MTFGIKLASADPLLRLPACHLQSASACSPGLVLVKGARAHNGMQNYPSWPHDLHSCSASYSTELPSTFWGQNQVKQCAKRQFTHAITPETSQIGALIRAEIHIDRRRHLEEAFKRQQEREVRAAEAEVSCPVDCVREVLSLGDFERELHEAEAAGELVVVDFYNSACGACKYVLPQFVKMCKLGCGEECDVGGHQGAVRFLKHHVRDDYDDLTDIAGFYKIKFVPMFSFFMDGCRVEQFATRDRQRLASTIGRLLQRYHEVSAQDRQSPIRENPMTGE